MGHLVGQTWRSSKTVGVYVGKGSFFVPALFGTRTTLTSYNLGITLVILPNLSHLGCGGVELLLELSLFWEIFN